MKYHVYALIKDSKCVYIGCSCNLIQRRNQHKKTKDFDSIVTIKSYKTKKEALLVENGIISFLTLFGDGNWYNAENILTSINRLKIRGQY